MGNMELAIDQIIIVYSYFRCYDYYYGVIGSWKTLEEATSFAENIIHFNTPEIINSYTIDSNLVIHFCRPVSKWDIAQ